MVDSIEFFLMKFLCRNTKNSKLTIFQWVMLFLLTLYFLFSPIETIIFWARQMFGVTEQRLNEYAVQMVETKKKQAVDKLETKKNRRV